MTLAEPGPAGTPFAPRSQAERSGLYVHVPFCSAICPYCDFAVSRQASGDGDRYVSLLAGEAARTSVAEGVVFDTLYFGGGTPSALSREQLARVFEALRGSLPLASDVSVTFEANPEDVDASSVEGWRQLGVHGVSVGLQSLDDAALRFLGRRHTAREGRESLQTLLAAGFEWVSADLIYSQPGSAPETFAGALEQLPELPHLSCYELTIHEGTPFARFEQKGRLVQLPNAEKAQWFRAVHDALAARGYEHYEVSNFAMAGARSRHNSKYWSGVPYLGLGPSAHSYDGARRWSNVAPWKEWASAIEAGRSPVSMLETLDAEARRLEELMLRFRTSDGVALDGFRERHGSDLRETHGAEIERYVEEQFLRVEGEWLRPTTSGMAIAERLAVDFSSLPESSA